MADALLRGVVGSENGKSAQLRVQCYVSRFDFIQSHPQLLQGMSPDQNMLHMELPIGTVLWDRCPSEYTGKLTRLSWSRVPARRSVPIEIGGEWKQFSAKTDTSMIIKIVYNRRTGNRRPDARVLFAAVYDSAPVQELIIPGTGGADSEVSQLVFAGNFSLLSADQLRAAGLSDSFGARTATSSVDGWATLRTISRGSPLPEVTVQAVPVSRSESLGSPAETAVRTVMRRPRARVIVDI